MFVCVHDALGCNDWTGENANLLSCVGVDFIKGQDFINPQEIAVHSKFNLTLQWRVSW